MRDHAHSFKSNLTPAFSLQSTKKQACIHECGPTCACQDDCGLRKTQRGIGSPVDVLWTGARGWGLFARTALPRGTYIGTYMGEILSERAAVERYDRVKNQGGCPDYQGAHVLYLSLYVCRGGGLHNMPRPLCSGAQLPPSMSYVPPHPAVEVELEGRKIMVIDATFAGNASRLINHSCEPNAILKKVHQRGKFYPAAAFFAARDIAKGEELTFNYDTKNNLNGGKKVRCCGRGRAVWDGVMDDGTCLVCLGILLVTFSLLLSPGWSMETDRVYPTTTRREQLASNESTLGGVKCECGASKCRGKL